MLFFGTVAWGYPPDLINKQAAAAMLQTIEDPGNRGMLAGFMYDSIISRLQLSA